MKDFKKIWKDLANKKEVTAIDTILYCLFKAYTAKSNADKVVILSRLLAKAFTPITNKNRLEKGCTPWSTLLYRVFWTIQRVKGDPKYLVNCKGMLSVFENTGEREGLAYLLIAAYKEINNSKSERFDPPYTYIFVRQDISNEQQLVQSSHIALELGAKMDHDFRGLHFTVIGVGDLKELEDTKENLEKLGISFEYFIEPDIGDQMTAIATYPIHAQKRRLLSKYRLLTFKENYA